MEKYFVRIWVFICIQQVVSGLPCALRQVQHGLVCVCNDTYCDTLVFDEPQHVGDYTIVSSSEAGLRFNIAYGQFQPLANQRYETADTQNHQRTSSKIIIPQVFQWFKPSQLFKRRISEISGNFLNPDTINMDVEITVNANKTFQKIVGFGGAFTGSVDYNLDQMSDALRQTVYMLYYSKSQGLAFNLMRLTIGGCDFDLTQWVYNESPPNDMRLSNFTQLNSRDISIIRKINELKLVTANSDIKFMGAAWGPPIWMKTSNSWNGPGLLRQEYFQLWADYHLRFLQLMKDQGLDFWALSTGNEPMNGIFGWIAINWLNLGWLPDLQAQFVSQNLGPSLKNSRFKDVKIFAGDDQRYIYPHWFNKMNSSYPKSMDFVDGFAVHFYWDRLIPLQQLDKTHRLYPDKVILNTESCMGDNPLDGRGARIGSWRRGEYYATDIIKNLRHWVTGWIDWNLVLDESGGPNYVNNLVDAAILVNTTSGKEIYKQPMYYALGHFSRFLPPGSVRISSHSTALYTSVVTFLRPDGRTVMVLCNQKLHAINLKITDPRRGTILLDVPAKSIHTIVYK